MSTFYGTLLPHVKRKWVKALRSGEYKQARRVLKRRTPEGFRHCCLGVVAEEMAPAECERREAGEYPVAGSTWLVPDDLAIQWGLTIVTQATLSRMNDGGKGFAAIADWIEENL